MLEWISANSDVINAVANVAMLFVWIAYLQVFLQSFRRQRRSKIVINQAAGSELDAACFISNMSSEAVYIESVHATLRWGDREVQHSITDYRIDLGDNADPRNKTFQGPLKQGDYASIGTFESIINRTKAEGEASPMQAEIERVSIEILVIGDHLSDDLLVGAKRTFIAHFDNGSWTIRPEAAATEQLRSRRERVRLHDQIRSQAADH